jgi:hypothetical protein
MRGDLLIDAVRLNLLEEARLAVPKQELYACQAQAVRTIVSDLKG